MLAGIIKGPNAYSPNLHPERCRARRQALLDQMKRTGTISRQEWETARNAPLGPVVHKPYSKRAPYFVDYLSRQLEAFYSPDDLTSLGLSIFTTMDTQVQQAAETALQNGLAALEAADPDLLRAGGTPLQGALVVIQPRTGAVLAMVGGRAYAASQFNRVTMARRQAGSTFKPFVYLAALDRKSAVSVLPNLPTTYTVDGKEWQPGNFSDVNRRALRLREALAQSVNRPTVHLAMEIGIEKVVATASAFGFSTPLPLYPSVALGAVEVIPIELARAYGVFAAEGILAVPMPIRDVLSGGGEPLQRQSVELVQTISPAKAYLMTSLLKSAVTEGTGKGIVSRGIRFPVAGKTGTTNDYRDAWFIGYTPDVLILVWVGFDDGASINATGAAAALPIWVELVRSIPHRFAGLDFVQPPGIVLEDVCLEDTEGRSPWPCQEIREEVFLEGVGPAENGLTGPGALIKRLLKGLKGGGRQN
jgi:penicillin-binding protein 1B